MSLQFMTFLSMLGLIFPAPVFAAFIEVENTRGVNFRIIGQGSDGKKVLKTLFTLPKYSVVEIPDQYLVDSSGNSVNSSEGADINHSINNWIRKGQITQKRFDDHGALKTDYFLPVSVHQVQGSNDYKDQTGFVALKSLAATGALRFITIDKVTVSSLQKSEVPKTSPAPNQGLKRSTESTEASVCLGHCSEQSAIGDIIHQLNQINTVTATHLKTKTRYTKKTNPLNDVQKATNNVLSRDSNPEFQNVKNNFNKTCFGLKFDDFKNYLTQKATENGIPAEILLGIMTAESGGRCHAVGDTNLLNKSIGLFQINSASSKNRLCSESDYSNLQNKTLTQMESISTCLQNPVVNLKNAIRIIKSAYQETNHVAPPQQTTSWSELSPEIRDNFRRALSAYNGSGKWVNFAAQDVKEVASKYGISLKNDWETQRLFYFRSILEKNGFIAKHPNGHRMYDFSISNLGYVEGILGRENGSQKQVGLADRWEGLLKPEGSSISVASNKSR